MSFTKILFSAFAAASLSAGLLSAGNATAADQGGFSSPGNAPFDWDKPLFSTPLFSDEPMGDQLDADVANIQRQERQRNQPPATSAGQRVINAQLDAEMRHQIAKVANYLYRYSLRNSSRFPGYTNDEMYAAQVQLTELVPNNPYAQGTTMAPMGQMASQYNANGSIQTGSTVWGDQWTEHLQAQQTNRIQLSVDAGLTPAEVDMWASDPPQTWQAAPGSIVGIGNNQGFFMVWGADANGNPVRNPATGKVYIYSGRTGAQVNDQIAPNEV